VAVKEMLIRQQPLVGLLSLTSRNDVTVENQINPVVGFHLKDM
jgi:hypothetical protein